MSIPESSSSNKSPPISPLSISPVCPVATKEQTRPPSASSSSANTFTSALYSFPNYSSSTLAPSKRPRNSGASESSEGRGRGPMPDAVEQASRETSLESSVVDAKRWTIHDDDVSTPPLEDTASPEVPAPLPREQLEIIDNLKVEKLIAGRSMYVISTHWYTQFRNWSHGEFRELNPIDNSMIIDSAGELFPRMNEGNDYLLIPDLAWKMLIQWHGSNGPECSRPTINTAEPPGENLLVEMHPLQVRLFTVTDQSQSSFPLTGANGQVIDELRSVFGKTSRKQSLPPLLVRPVLSISRAELWSTFRTQIVELLGLEPQCAMRLHKIGNLNQIQAVSLEASTLAKLPDRYDLVTLDSSSIDSKMINHDLSTNADLAVEIQSIDFTWPVDDYKELPIPLELWDESDSKVDSGSSWNFPYTKPISFPSSHTPINDSSTKDIEEPKLQNTAMYCLKGETGLQNLGNTCYMNSALQCLSHVEELTKYFLSDAYTEEINTDNPLGSGGLVVRSYAILIHKLFENPPESSYAPRGFKSTIGRFAPAFSGYQQQDAQEFLAFLLDGLHEDLNRVLKKPYTEKPDLGEFSDQKIRELALRCWDTHKLRNDSVIVDLIQGLYKSTLVCPECNKVSVSFDPYMDLTLPLPIIKKWKHEIKFVPWDVSTPIKVVLDKNSTIRTMKEFIADRLKLDPKKLWSAEVWKQTFYKHHYDSETTSDVISEHDNIFVYELPISTESTSETLASSDEQYLVPIVTSRDCPSKASWSSIETTCYPFFIALSHREASSYDTIYNKIRDKYHQFTTAPQLLYVDESKPSSPESNSDIDQDYIDVKMDENPEGSIVEIKKAPPLPKRPSPAPPPPVKLKLIPRSTHRDPFPTTLGNPSNLSEIKDMFTCESPPRDVNMEEYVDTTGGITGPFTPPDDLLEPSYHFGSEQSILLKTSVTSSNNYFEDPSPRYSDSEDPQMKDASEEEDVLHRPCVIDHLPPFGPPDSLENSRSNSRSGVPWSSPNSDVLSSEILVHASDGILCEWAVPVYDSIFPAVETEVGGIKVRGLWDESTFFHDENLEAEEEAAKKAKHREVNLADCLDEFSKTEELGEEDTWYCPNCREHRRATKTFELWNVADIVVMHLKRFSSARALNDKIDDLIEFPLQGLNLNERIGSWKSNTDPNKEDFIYDCFAVANHMGGTGGGHYTAYARNFKGDKWFSYNDSFVKHMDSARVVSPSAYLIFYRRRKATGQFAGGEKYTQMLNDFEIKNSKPREVSSGLVKPIITSAGVRFGNDSSASSDSTKISPVKVIERFPGPGRTLGETLPQEKIKPLWTQTTPTPTTTTNDEDEGYEAECEKDDARMNDEIEEG
ncbi:putative ubiquitin carboxyl-terminal hydrolase 12 [Neolecta irregularis DAH-3]|uniref:ubiquitinyl hydrolase 1 n=1 Tax=Neolecta irregularis (strain DAH-3) TaxID=1198029 RepID=A0A1U7LVE1_NEOID|nr:putative ubiquitin carboxyl-terminal hydrolase 12 [Neolecta irregularis DAH-3]|eukprot:OLL26627.1 putative ubiquitin carboxyl-terminal hydrolase 12 [Neolecta irregularis DAH-3]